MIQMEKKADNNIFNATNALKVLFFMTENPGKDFLGSEIQKATSLSRAGVYLALRDLIKQNLVIKANKGKFSIYSLAYSDPIVKQFKVLKNILSLKAAIDKIKPSAKKIILYGSASRGEDFADSDIDLFILSKETALTNQALRAVKIKRRVQAVIKSPSEASDIKERDSIFYDEVNRGIVLWEEKE